MLCQKEDKNLAYLSYGSRKRGNAGDIATVLVLNTFSQTYSFLPIRLEHLWLARVHSASLRSTPREMSCLASLTRPSMVDSA